MMIGSKELIRDMNLRLVLETIIKNKTISRASISKELGLTKATISTIVQDLMNKGLIQEIDNDNNTHVLTKEPSSNSLGRKPILLSFNKKAGYAAAIDIGTNTVSILVTDLLGDSKKLKKIRTPMINELIPAITNLLADMIPSSSDSLYGLVGIATAIHGIVSDNNIIFTPYYNLKGLNIAENLYNHFSVPVLLENEANLSVIGEQTYITDSYSNIANLSIHSGAGLGLIIDNKLYTGKHGYAGEFGHTIIELNGRECPCGNKGCLEQYLSEQALLNEYAAKSDNIYATLDEFIKAYNQNDIHALHTAEHFTEYLTVCINNILNNINPDVIIINNSFTNMFPELINKASAALSSEMNDKIPILPSKLQDMSTLLGGISLIVKGFLKIDHVNFIPFTD